MNLYQQLMKIRPQIAQAAQGVYDSWEQDEEGFDDVLGGGGICDEIFQVIESVINQNIPDVETREAGQDGGDHSWVLAYNKQECYEIDIPCSVYESGGGYSWKKIHDVIIRPEDVYIGKLNREDYDFDNDYY